MRRIVAEVAALTLFSCPFLAQAQPVAPAAAGGDAVRASPLAPYETVERDGIRVIAKPLTNKPGDPKEGAKVVINRRLGNCLACHQVSALEVEPFHGEVGPALDGVASRWDEAALRMIIVNPKLVFTEETVMPAFHRMEGLNRVRAVFKDKPILTAQQVEDVVAFLGALK